MTRNLCLPVLEIRLGNRNHMSSTQRWTSRNIIRTIHVLEGINQKAIRPNTCSNTGIETFKGYKFSVH